MTPIPRIAIAELIVRYKVFLIDQFGVLRDDLGPYAGAVDALLRVKASGKTVIILSNSGRSGRDNARRFEALGFPRTSFDCFLTSGDVAQRVIASDRNLLPTGIRRCFTISSADDTALADSLGLVSTTTAGDADIVIISGSQAERISLDAYRDMLRPAAHRGAPCVCTNPDLEKLSNGMLVPAAGRIAQLYETLGGSVIKIGKPFPEIYRQAMRLSRAPDTASVICIGDSLHHDIKGAHDAGLDSVLVRTGVHASLNDKELYEQIVAAATRPTFFMPKFSAIAAANGAR